MTDHLTPTSGGFPRPPAHLNSFGKRKWKELYPVLEAADRIAEADLTTFEALCFHYGLYREMWQAIYRPKGPDGKRYKRSLEDYLEGKNSQNAPELTVMRESLKEFEKLSSEFGMSPLARKKAGSKDPQKQDSPMMQYIQAMNERMKRKAQ